MTMANILLDAELVLVPGGTVVTANTTYPPVRVPMPFAPTCAWVIAVSAVNNGPEYTFFLEWSPSQAGVYTVCSTFVLPTVTQPTNFPVGVGGGLFHDWAARWLRLRVVIGGGGRSVTFGSGFTKLTGRPGLGARAGEIPVAL
jgi:hypothetical protein